jgi:S-(hydroxymethyl)glutathione dehydrogenase/alcohol dehydrogenase
MGYVKGTSEWLVQYSLRLAENSSVAVFGIGCVGLSILQGARAKKCARVFAIDTNPKKEEWAKKFGASTSLSIFMQSCGTCVAHRPTLKISDNKRGEITPTADFINPKDLPEGKSIVEYLVEQTDGGLDFTYDATGNVCFIPPPPILFWLYCLESRSFSSS